MAGGGVRPSSVSMTNGGGVGWVVVGVAWAVLDGVVGVAGVVGLGVGVDCLVLAGVTAQLGSRFTTATRLPCSSKTMEKSPYPISLQYSGILPCSIIIINDGGGDGGGGVDGVGDELVGVGVDAGTVIKPPGPYAMGSLPCLNASQYFFSIFSISDSDSGGPLTGLPMIGGYFQSSLSTFLFLGGWYVRGWNGL